MRCGQSADRLADWEEMTMSRQRAVVLGGNFGGLTTAVALPPRKHGVLIPGPQTHAMKIAFEKYFQWKACHSYVNLP
jgi:hypothetical protein